VGFKAQVLAEKYPDRQTRHPASPVVQGVNALSMPVDSCEKNQGLLNGVLGSGFAVFSIDKAGYIQQVYGTSHELLSELNIWDDPPSRSRILAVWNWRLWACIADVPDEALQLKLIGLQDGYTGVVAWSNKQPSVLEVVLTSLDRIGLDIDPAWRQLLFGGVLDRFPYYSGLIVHDE